MTCGACSKATGYHDINCVLAGKPASRQLLLIPNLEAAAAAYAKEHA